MNNENKKCVVCFEEKKMSYECDICSDGKMCSSCYLANWEYCEDRFMEKMREWWRYGRECEIEQKELLTEIIKCPCCRSYNWKIVYSSIFDELIENYDVMFKKNTSEYIKEIANNFKDWWDEKCDDN